MAARLWRLCNLLMAAFFGLAAAVQVNDPDAGLWTVVYLVPAALTLLVSINPSITDNGVWRSLCDLHSAGCVVGTIALACSLLAYAQGNIFHEEEGRELFGLVIVAIWMSLCRSSANSVGFVLTGVPWEEFAWLLQSLLPSFPLFRGCTFM
ncbi:transmembrane protein 220 isoform X2 [Anomalospiza imberbis]|uniref:transmembrane protein 220 isoform X2 n=1 Tax=Anomalospiza imberbis TaxID=187417 RepID=UPI0035902E1B